MSNKEGYKENSTQKERLLKVLQEGKKVCQIDLNYYLKLRDYEEMRGSTYLFEKSDFIDAIADLGIANLPARIFGLKKDGYDIKTEKVEVKGRFCNTYYCVYYL